MLFKFTTLSYLFISHLQCKKKFAMKKTTLAKTNIILRLINGIEHTWYVIILFSIMSALSCVYTLHILYGCTVHSVGVLFQHHSHTAFKLQTQRWVAYQLKLLLKCMAYEPLNSNHYGLSLWFFSLLFSSLSSSFYQLHLSLSNNFKLPD